MAKWMVVAALALAGLAGCKQEVTETGSGGAASTQPGTAAKKEYVFGIIAKANNNPVFQAARKGAEDAAKELGARHGLTIRIEWRTPDKENAQEQANNLEQLTLARVDGIAISCSDASVVTKAIDDAVAAGVPVMTFDSDAAQSKRFCFHGIDDEECGQQVMQHLGDTLGKKGVVAVLAGNRNAPNLQKRVAGLRAMAEAYPEITIKDVYDHAEDAASASARVEEVQTANPDITGWAMVGGWPLFSDALLRNPAFAQGKVKIVAVDALPAMLPYVRQGVAPVLLAQQVYGWGYRSVELLLDKAAFGRQPEGVHDVSELIAVTKENVDEYAKNWEKWLPQ